MASEPRRFIPQRFDRALDDKAVTSNPHSLERILAEGSKSFNAAARLLPERIRRPVTVLYAFCRISDDAVDHSENPRSAVDALHRRLDNIYSGHPTDNILDQAFSETVTTHRIPKAILSGLFEGFEWDATGRQYETPADTADYCARVASTVGVMMTLIMGERRPEVLARACDLGLAMQLVNICRDVGEDADMGRVYLPNQWLKEAGIDREAFLAHPAYTPALGAVVGRTLEMADRHFALADIGISLLPRDARLAIRAAALIYADIGRVIRKNHNNSVTTRAYTGRLRKLWLCLRAVGARFWVSRRNTEDAHPSMRFLIEAVVKYDEKRAGRSISPMIPANKSPWFVRWFSKQTEKRIRSMFSRVYVRGEDRLLEVTIETPVLVVSNHTSWWDPMMAIYLAHRLLRADAFAMMDERNLRKLPFLGRVGGFGFQLDNATDIRRVLAYAARLLDRPGRLVWIFPEGAERPRASGIDQFKPGAAVVARWAKGCRVVPVALRYEFGGREHPEGFISIGEPLAFFDNIEAARQAQREGVSAELKKIDSFIRDRNADAAFVLKMEQTPRWTGILAERILGHLTRYEKGKNR